MSREGLGGSVEEMKNFVRPSNGFFLMEVAESTFGVLKSVLKADVI